MSKTVLIVDDNADTRLMIKILLESYDYQVLEAENGQEAIEKATLQRPDLILMDIMMPMMDGVTATEIIRKVEGLENVPIVALTALQGRTIEKELDAGFNEIISKPLDFDKFEKILNHFLEK